MSRNNSTYLNSMRFNSARNLERRRNEEDKLNNLVDPLVNKVVKVHWYLKNNAKQHNTSKFDQIHDISNPKPVLRRGQAFYVSLRFGDRDINLNTDRIILIFKFGSRPSVSKGTMSVLLVGNTKFTKTQSEWDVRVDQGTTSRDLVLQVFTPTDAPVGIWRLEVRSGLQDRSQGRESFLFKDETDVFILFNPWCKGDSVYMEDADNREEYVMNETGSVYMNTHRRPRARAWAFGQFDDVVLPVACIILEFSKFRDSQRGNVIQVVRGISAGVNSRDNDGILLGSWDNNYGDGVAPTKWTGSVQVLEDYVENGYNPVKYGQCWVFSGITTTICRALGIPCRSVTNYISAHDTDSSLTIDKFFDKSGNLLSRGQDTVWNFHVWNDVWMARDDLPKGYGGWQAIDATPQEESESKMQCGPASLEAIRRGDISLSYDCPFVFAEVNADMMHWVQDDESDSGYSRSKINPNHIGRSILTRKPGDDGDFGESISSNIKNEYKNPDGTAADKLAVHNAIRGSKRAQQYYEYKSDIKEDVVFKLIEVDSVFVGDSFKVKVVIRNESDETRNISAAVSARSVFYTGVVHSLIKKSGGNVKLGPKEELNVELTAHYSDYWKKLQEQCMIKVYAICRVVETGQSWTDEDDISLEKPTMDIEVPDEIKRANETEFVMSFKNPLDEELTDCTLNIDGSGLLRPRSINIPESVEAHEQFTYTFMFSPRIHGKRKFIVNFNSQQLLDISGSKTVQVMK